MRPGLGPGLALIGCAWIALAPGPAGAEGGDDVFRRGRQELGLALGHGLGLDFGAEGSGDFEALAALPRWGVALTDPLGEGAWYRGGLSLLVEGAFLWATQPDEAAGGGATLVLRYHFLRGGRLIPFVEAGAGMLGTDFDVPGQHDGFNFTLQAGAGAHVPLSSRVALTGEWRFHHISNAQLNEPNGGINDNLLLLGVTYFLD
jgi:opacity protein-like surface antigen